MANRITVDGTTPDLDGPAEAIRSGQLVVFPTETVYGLGANALDSAAVQRIFQAKGRPASNPLIVHVADIDQARRLAVHWPETAQLLTERFWPGPLTIVLRKSSCVPDAVTAEGATVALRCPGHSVALQLVRESGVPIAAPSANLSGYLSPTQVAHLAPEIVAAAAWIVDGGPCHGGIESTVLDLDSHPPAILRHGLIGSKVLAEALGIDLQHGPPRNEDPPRSPGLLLRHYAPSCPVALVESGTDPDAVLDRMSLHRYSKVAYLMVHRAEAPQPAIRLVAMPDNPELYARVLYDTLHQIDAERFDVIVVEMPPDTSEWNAIRDRLQRASIR